MAIERCAAAALLLAASSAGAHVTETGSQTFYDVRQAAGTSLLQALNQATPIREAGLPFHGYTAWHVQWNYRYETRPDGACAITSVDVRLSVTMTLPALKQGTVAGTEEFARFLPALVRHEDGHRQIGRDAAREIDAGIAGLPPMASCPLLEREANGLGHAVIERAKKIERGYDESTRHGCAQGACVRTER